MDNPNITMEEYIRLEEEKAQKQGETFDWQTATGLATNEIDLMEYSENSVLELTRHSTKPSSTYFLLKHSKWRTIQSKLSGEFPRSNSISRII
ncbi:hypothetical protein Tco_0597760 [Tanacetum coccineum]